MPDVAEGALTGGRAAGISSGSGYRLDREGVHFARGVLGDLASTNFVSGASGTGWQLKEDGTGEMNSVTVNLANVRGVLTADHVDAGNLISWKLLWTGNRNVYSATGFTSTGGAYRDFPSLVFVVQFQNSISYAVAPVVMQTSLIPSTSPSTLRQISWSRGHDGTPYLTSTTRLRIDYVEGNFLNMRRLYGVTI